MSEGCPERSLADALGQDFRAFFDVDLFVDIALKSRFRPGLRRDGADRDPRCTTQAG